MKKFTIETNLFKDANELNIFVQNVRDMRTAQTKFEKPIYEDLYEHNAKARLNQKFDLEKQVDDTLKSLPEVGAIFL